MYEIGYPSLPAEKTVKSNQLLFVSSSIAIEATVL